MWDGCESSPVSKQMTPPFKRKHPGRARGDSATNKEAQGGKEAGLALDSRDLKPRYSAVNQRLVQSSGENGARGSYPTPATPTRSSPHPGSPTPGSGW